MQVLYILYVKSCLISDFSHYSDLTADDNHTLSDKTTLYKTCEPVKRLPKCKYFKDAAWIIYSFPDSNATQQIVNCHCPKFSVTYLLKKLPYTTPSGEQGNQYQFACSPQSVSSLSNMLFVRLSQ